MEQELVKALRGLKELEGSLVKRLDDQAVELKKTGGTSTHTAVKLQDLEDKHDSLEKEVKGMVAEFKTRIDEFELKANRPNMSPEAKAHRGLMTNFIETKEFKQYSDNGWHGQSTPVEVPFSQRKDISGDTYLRNIFAFEKVQQIFADPLRPNRIRDLFPVIPTSASTVEFVVEDVYLNEAAMVPEGGTKPTSAFNFIDKSYAMRTLAHGLPVNRQTLNDIGALEAYLNLRLTEGLKEVEDVQLLYGSGLNSNLQGVLTVDGIQTYLWSSGAVGDTRIDAVRKAMTLSQLAYYPVDGIAMHPIDWQDIELQKATTGLYVWVNVATGATPMLWKVPIVVSTAFTQGDFMLGAFKMAAAIWDRETVNMRMTDSHGYQFMQNIIQFLLEERLCLTVFRPKSIVYGKFDSAPVS